MSNLIITTKMAFPILNLINKLKLRTLLIDTITKQIALQNTKESIYRELNQRSNTDVEITPELMIELLNQNIDLAEKLESIENEIRTDSMNFIFTIVEKIPDAENEFYKTISTVTGEKIKDIEQKDISEIVDLIQSIVLSKSFMGLFNAMKK